jgi:hypothetical protein
MRLQIAFLTGRSDPQRCALSPQQAHFLAELAGPGRSLVAQNFPYDQRTLPWRQTPLWRASWCNLREHLGRRRERFLQQHRPAVRAMLERAPHTVLLAGSCGTSLWLAIATPAMAARASVLAFGPVTRQRPPGRSLVLQGRRDWLSRLFAGTATAPLATGHLGYLDDPQMLTRCRAFVEAIERELPA